MLKNTDNIPDDMLDDHRWPELKHGYFEDDYEPVEFQDDIDERRK